jgi:hypothetical protein
MNEIEKVSKSPTEVIDEPQVDRDWREMMKRLKADPESLGDVI